MASPFSPLGDFRQRQDRILHLDSEKGHSSGFDVSWSTCEASAKTSAGHTRNKRSVALPVLRVTNRPRVRTGNNESRQAIHHSGKGSCMMAS
jgi:hypothetical protein